MRCQDVVLSHLWIFTFFVLFKMGLACTRKLEREQPLASVDFV